MDETKAMNYAYELAKQYANDNDTLPKESRENEQNYIEKSIVYEWPNDAYGWNDYSIIVYEDELDFSKDIINETSFNECD